jgi:hypothetical protein
MSTVYETITQRIVEKLDAGTVPWRQPWGGEHRLPRNMKTDQVYRGVNLFLLGMLGYESPYFVTFKQARELGGTVRKGEHGCPVIFWNWVDKRTGGAGTTGSEAAAPVFVEVGFVDRFELVVEPIPYAAIRPKIGESATGVGDLEVTLIGLLLHQRPYLPAISVAAEVKAPTARNQLIGTRE